MGVLTQDMQTIGVIEQDAVDRVEMEADVPVWRPLKRAAEGNIIKKFYTNEHYLCISTAGAANLSKIQLVQLLSIQFSFIYMALLQNIISRHIVKFKTLHII